VARAHSGEIALQIGQNRLSVRIGLADQIWISLGMAKLPKILKQSRVTTLTSCHGDHTVGGSLQSLHIHPPEIAQSMITRRV
jgi:hypothetical protein